MSYTNSAGTGSRTGQIVSINATTTARTLYTFDLDSGDVGVRSIQSITLGTSLVSGAVSLIAFVPYGMAYMPVNLPGQGWVTPFSECCVEVPNGACLQTFTNGIAPTRINGELFFTFADPT
jgi:hypothetical protein